MIERDNSEATIRSGRVGRTGTLLSTRRSALALAAAGAVLLASCGTSSGVGDDATATTTADLESAFIGPPFPEAEAEADSLFLGQPVPADVVCLGPPVPDDVACPFVGPPVPADVVSLLVGLPVPDADVESALIGPPFPVAEVEAEVIDP